MIPRKLQIKNFLSYGDEPETIDFSFHRLICLSGKNGHGKSALLDAMTWAVWGQARKISSSSKADEGLLRLGQDTMMVVFDFELNGQSYRIKREYIHRYGKPYTGLEFGIIDTTTDSYRPLTGKTIRDTQTCIEQNIKLTFDAFINSAFLRQGQSNEFSKKSPKERKDILAAILGLHEYDTIRKLALEKTRQFMQEKHTLTTLQETIAKELESLTPTQHSMQEVIAQLHDLDAKEQQLLHEAEAITTQQKELYTQQQKLDIAQLTKETLLREQEQLRTELIQLRSTWRMTHALQQSPSDRQSLEIERQTVTSKIQAHQQALHEQLRLQEKLLALKTTQQTVEHTLRQELAVSIQHAQVLCERLKSDLLNYTSMRTQYEQQMHTVTTQLQQLALQETTLTQQNTHASAHFEKLTTHEQQFIKRKSYYQKYIAHANWLTAQLRALKEQRHTTTTQKDPSCPQCEQPLSVTQCTLLTDRLRKQEQSIEHQIRRLGLVINGLKSLLVEQHATLATLKSQQEEYVQRSTRIAETKKQRSATQELYDQLHKTHHATTVQLTQTQQQLDVTSAQLKVLQSPTVSALEHNEIYQELGVQIRTIQEQLKHSTYNASDYAHAQQQLATLEAQLTNTAHHEKNITLQEHRTEQIHMLCQRLKKIKLECVALEAILAHTQALRIHHEQLVTRASVHKQTSQELSERKAHVLQHKGRLETKLQMLGEQHAQLLTHTTRIQQLTESMADYEQIATATGKDGIQALLIEEAIPEIEQEANQLLAKLTNNQAQLLIESLRDLKKGGTKETLDIKISDSSGIRPYELFSGGEAFRIDFALRIAISKLLARRAGTALQTLIIDEGFGSQDDEGLSHIMDSMYTIQEDFQKIIIVSHLPSMKNQFPVHFWVEKRPSGSRVTVIEQD